MAGLRIEGNTSGYVAEVNSSNELKVALSSVKVTANNGAGGTESLAHPFISMDRRLSVGMDTLMFSDEFTGSVQNTSLWKYNTSTATMAFSPAGWIVLNTANSSAVNARCSYETYRTFSFINRSSLLLEGTVMLLDAAVPATGLNYYFGLTPTNTTTPGTPQEGVYFHISSNGIDGKISVAGATVATTNLVSSGTLEMDKKYKLTVMFNYSKAYYFVNDILKGELVVPDGVPQPGLNTAPPISISHFNSGAVSGTVARLKVGNVAVYLMDAETPKPWSHIMSGQGMIATQIQNNGTNTGGRLTMYSPSALPTAYALTNSTIATGNAKGSGVTGSLGGFYRVLPTLTANNDGILCSYLNPQATTNIVPNVLYVTGVKIQGAVTTTLTGGPVIYSYMVSYGNTAINYSSGSPTTESATTKEARIVPIGFESYATTAAAGTLGQGVYMQFVTPIVVNPGEYFTIIARNVGTVTTGGEICINVAVDGYYE